MRPAAIASASLESVACTDPHHCVTCGDDGVPMRVLQIDADQALARCVDEGGVQADVETALVELPSVGERVLVHAGVAIARLPQIEEVTG